MQLPFMCGYQRSLTRYPEHSFHCRRLHTKNAQPSAIDPACHLARGLHPLRASCTRAVWLVHSVHGVSSTGDWLDHATKVSRATVRSDRPRRPMGLLGHPDVIGPWHPCSSATRSCRRRVRPVQPIRDGADEIGSGKRSLGKSTGNTSDGASTTPWGEWGDGCLRWDVAFS